MRIVSLIPSATEIICLLGLENQLVGVTHKCDYPPSVKSLPVVTSTAISDTMSSQEVDQIVHAESTKKTALYDIDMNKLIALAPDCIITQSLCDVCAVSEDSVQLAAKALPGTPQIYNLAPTSLSSVMQTILMLGKQLGRPEIATVAVKQLIDRINAVTHRTQQISSKRLLDVVFLEWLDPLFSTGHWIPEMITQAGGRSQLSQPGLPSKRIHWADLQAIDPAVLFIACCGYNVDRTLQDLARLQTDPDWQALRCVGTGRVYVTDGNAYFSKPTPRLVDSLEILAHALHPEMHPPHAATAITVY